MKRPIPTLLILLLALVLAAPALARKEKAEKPVPDLTGVWKGTTQSVAMGKLGHTDATTAPKFLHVDFTLTIDKQEGPNFYGTKTSAKGKETVLGVIHGHLVSMVDDDGIYNGRLTSAHSLQLIYLEAGTNSKVASITTYEREDKDAKEAPAPKDTKETKEAAPAQ
jgi:hypothetical protein